MPGPYRTRRTTDLSPATRPLRRARTPTPRREKRRFCAGFLLSWGFEEDGRGRGHGHGGGGSSHPHGEALHGTKSGRGKARWCGAGGHRELQPSHLHAQIQNLQKMSCSSEGSRCWMDNGYMPPVNDGNKKKAMQKGYQRTLTILSRVKNSLCKDGLVDQGSVKVMLLCGSDLLEPFSKPGVWVPDQVQNLDTFWYRKGMGATSLNQRVCFDSSLHCNIFIILRNSCSCIWSISFM